MNRVSAPSAPSIDGLQVLVQSRRSRPPHASPNSLDHSLQVYLQTRSITVSKCISKFTRSWPPCASPNSLDYGLQVHNSKLARSRPPSSHEHGLKVRLQTRSITIQECIFKFTRSGPPSVSACTLDYCLQVHLQTRSIMASECISEFTQLSFSGVA